MMSCETLSVPNDPADGSLQKRKSESNILLPSLGSKPTHIPVETMSFLVMDAPKQSNLHLYIKECRRHGVTDLVRVCQATYAGEADLHSAGIELHEMSFDDGLSPPKHVIEKWLDLVHARFFGTHVTASSADQLNNTQRISSNAASPAIAPLRTATIAVHCVAGLGRAPVLVAIALIEFADMDPVDAVSIIRRHRRGAINGTQLNYLEKYRKSYKKGIGETRCDCVIL